MLKFALLLVLLFSKGDACFRTFSRLNLHASDFQPMYDYDERQFYREKPKLTLPLFLRGCRPHATDSARVFLTISSLPPDQTHSDRLIELNWYNVLAKRGDWVGLFTIDPCSNTNDIRPIEYVDATDYPLGYYSTKTRFPRPQFHESNLTATCLGFWIAYVRGDLILASGCKKTQPQWMWENRKSIEDLTLAQLMIPGTHLSGSYKTDVTGSESLDSLIGPFETTQDEDMWNQLVYGNRYLEISVALHANSREHWLQFEEFLANPLIPALNQIRNFVEATNEIVILDIHTFLKGFRFHNVSISRRHRILVKKLTDILQPYLIPKSLGLNATLKQLWSQNKRIYISYNDENFIHDQHLWPGIPHFFVETVYVEMLITYFERFAPSFTGHLWAAQAHLTPNDDFKHRNYNSSLRHLADESNKYFTEWFRDFWWDKVNIVATDFFHGNNLIEVAIEVNQEKTNIFK